MTLQIQPFSLRLSLRYWVWIPLSLLATLPIVATSPEAMDQIALGWIEAHNSGDVEQMEAHRIAHREGYRENPADDWKPQFAQLVGDLGVLEATDIRPRYSLGPHRSGQRPGAASERSVRLPSGREARRGIDGNGANVGCRT